MSQNGEIILVDFDDRPIGFSTKEKAHREGLLHRAFSVFLFNSEGQLLLQRRAKEKYHSGGLWSNSCCSHPHGENKMRTDLQERLFAELGVSVKQFKKAGEFIYRKKFSDDLYEYEYDHIYLGSYDGQVLPDPQEIMDYRWMDMDALYADVVENPERYTAWFMTALLIAGKNNHRS